MSGRVRCVRCSAATARPPGVGEAAAAPADGDLRELRGEVARLQERLGRRPKILVGKPGLDGHSNGAEQIAVRARDAGMDVVYEGIRMTPEQIAASALQEGVHVIGLSILSGSHRELIPAVMAALHEAGVTAPVVVGGIIPEQDVAMLEQAGVAAVYTPKDFDITRIMRDIVELVGAGAEHLRTAARASRPTAPPPYPARRERRRSRPRRASARTGPERGAGHAEPAGEHHARRPRAVGAAAAARSLPRRSAARRRGT